jgi:hypothetical protein
MSLAIMAAIDRRASCDREETDAISWRPKKKSIAWRAVP